MTRKPYVGVVGIAIAIVLGSGMAVAKTITIDGDFSDWEGTPSATAHTVTTSSDEWIYSGRAGDERTDLSAQANDNDIVDFRVTKDSGFVYFYFEMDDIDNTWDVLIAIGIDIDTNPSDTGMNWLGPDSDTSISDPGKMPEYNIAIHNVTGQGVTQIEIFDESLGYWQAPQNAGWAAYFSDTEDRVEVAIPLADVGLDGDIFDYPRLTVMTMGNNAQWASSNNASIDIGGASISDGIDVMAGPDGSTGSAWDRDLSNQIVDFHYNVPPLPVGDWTEY